MPTVLVATPNTILGIMIARLLQKEGYDCQIEKRSEDALACIRSTPLAFVVCQVTWSQDTSFITTIQAAHPTLPILSLCFAKQEQIRELTTLTKQPPIAIPFTEDHFRQQVQTLRANVL